MPQIRKNPGNQLYRVTDCSPEKNGPLRVEVELVVRNLGGEVIVVVQCDRQNGGTLQHIGVQAAQGLACARPFAQEIRMGRETLFRMPFLFDWRTWNFAALVQVRAPRP